MATRRLFPTLSHKPVLSRSTSMSSKRHSSTTTNGSQQRQTRRPPKQQQQQQQRQQQQRRQPANPNSRPTHFLALPIGHHPELRNAMSALSSSWLAHEPPIEGLDPSIVVHPRRLHLTLGVMALGPNSDPNPNPSSGQGQGQGHDLAGATALLDSLAPRIRAVLAQSPLHVPLGRLTVIQSDPRRAHVLYAEPDVRSPDGRRLRAVCGACCLFFSIEHHLFFFLHPSHQLTSSCGSSTDLIGFCF
jgi:activating signal cointegrator complex subunit 1